MDGVAVHQGHDLRTLNLTDLNVHQGKSLLPYLCIQVLEEVFPVFFIFLHNFLFTVQIILAFEKLGDFLFQGFNKIMDILFELLPLARL